MKIKNLIENEEYKLIAGKEGVDKEIEGVYICDLLSWVMSHATKNNAWITVQTNINVIAVALLAEVSCIIIPEDIEIDQSTIKKADSENITIISTKKSQYEIAIDLYKQI
jgi:predicted transcriptional regulator